MVTRAELEAELARLRQELARRAGDDAGDDANGGGADDAGDAPAGAASGRSGGADDAGPGGNVPGTAADGTAEDGTAALERLLAAQGLERADLERLAGQLSDELGELMSARPALTAVTLLALGFVLGRMSK